MSIRFTVSVMLLIFFTSFLIFIYLTCDGWVKVFYYYFVLVIFAFLKNSFVVILFFGFCFVNILEHKDLTRSLCVFFNWSLWSASLVWLNTFTLTLNLPDKIIKILLSFTVCVHIISLPIIIILIFLSHFASDESDMQHDILFSFSESLFSLNR